MTKTQPGTQLVLASPHLNREVLHPYQIEINKPPGPQEKLDLATGMAAWAWSITVAVVFPGISDDVTSTGSPERNRTMMN